MTVNTISDRALQDKFNSQVGFVVIGRNEGDRLVQCLKSIFALGYTQVVYVDSASSDGSVHTALQMGAVVVELDRDRPFTAARARNEGYQRLRLIEPTLCYVQFIDGDCLLFAGWLNAAITFIQDHADVAAVCGRRRERYPTASTYNALCEAEWNTPVGEAKACGGDVLIRTEAFESVEGYRSEMIAGEEPELCVRLRARGWKIWRLRDDMTLHDARILLFSQWWRRTIRNGYAYALGAHLHGKPPERHWVWESRRALLWGFALPAVSVVALLLNPLIGLALLLAYPAQIFRQVVRNGGSLSERSRLAIFQTLGRFPEAIGCLKFASDRVFWRSRQIIEYK